jgi:succinate dehydrogenase / fumarate reductase flavoprotein subunit
MAMGSIAGENAALKAKTKDVPSVDRDQVEAICRQSTDPLERRDGIRPQEIKRDIRRIMSRYLMFDRKADDLRTGIKELEQIKNEKMTKMRSMAQGKRFNKEWIETLEARNMLDVAEMAFASALTRTESRGLHERAEYPAEDPSWLKHILLQNVTGKMSIRTEPVIFSRVNDKI